MQTKDKKNLHVVDIIDYIDKLFKEDKKVFLNVLNVLLREDAKIRNFAIDNYKKNYCMRFPISDKKIEGLDDVLGIGVSNIIHAYNNDWHFGLNARMYAQYYYLILISFVTVSMLNDPIKNKEYLRLGYSSLNHILYRIWNGRHYKMIKYCDPETMLYVIKVMMNKKYLATKYNTPYDVIVKYFTPTIFEKYLPYVKKNILEAKRIFTQCHNRIEQLFKSDYYVDIETNQPRYRSGLAPLYYEAKRKNLKYTGNEKTTDEKDSQTLSIDDYLSTDHVATHIEKISRDISHGYVKGLPTDVVSVILRETRPVSKTLINSMIETLPDKDNYTKIYDIVNHLFKQFASINKTDIICTKKVYPFVKKTFITSKNNKTVNEFKTIIDSLLDEMFKKMSIANSSIKSFDSYSVLMRIRIRTALLMIITYYVSKYYCEKLTNVD